MTLLFNLRKNRTRKDRTYRKFPRQKFKNFETVPRNLKEWGYCKHNWYDYTYVSGDIKKFLIANKNCPIDKVLSKFIKRCSNLGKYSPREALFDYIQKKEDINPKFGGFYLTNGILNYKKPIKNNQPSISYTDINRKQFNKLDLHKKIKTLCELHIPQCLGTYYLKYVRKPVYMDLSSIFNDWRDQIDKTRVICSIPGIGYGINLNVINTQTGKTKFIYNIIDDWFQSSHPNIYFYYLNK